MKATREMVEKIRTGDPISDGELSILIEHLDKAESVLKPLGPDFRLALKEVRRLMETVEGYKRARSNKN